MAKIDYKAIENSIQNDLLECRRLFTRSVTDIPKYSTLEKIHKNYPDFMRECFKAHKTALKNLVDGILRIENLITQINVTGVPDSGKNQTVKLEYWKYLLEVSYNALVWLAVGMDRSNVKKIFKGPKFGNITHQNIQSVLIYVNQLNEDPNVIAIPLDFCSFSPICDVLELSYFESDKTLKVICIEIKSGKVNDEMLETIESGTMDAYFRFFDTYGKTGIKQMERFFRQRRMLEKSQKLIHAVPGIYENPSNPQTDLLILANEAKIQHFSDKVVELLDKSERKEFAVDQIDNCLALGAINAEDKEMLMLGEYDLRLYAYHSFINPSTLCGAPYPKDLHVILDTIKLSDWREGFSSVILYPIILRQIPNQSLMDLLFCRKIIRLCFNPQRFVALCNENGLKADLTSTKETDHLKARGIGKGCVDFDGHFIYHSLSDSSTIFDEGPFLGEGLLHEMLYNWVHPKSVIEQIKQVSFPKQE